MKKYSHILVLGAGVVGVTTAWYLRQAGFEVTVIDRNAAAGMETSKANGGQISVSHAQPWANPAAPAKIFKWLFSKDAPLRFHPALDTQQLRWGLQFLSQCSHAHTQHNIKQLVALGMYSRAALQALREELALDYQQKSKGILHFYTSPHLFEAAKLSADCMSKLGCERQLLSAQQALAIEPALASVAGLVGATFTPADESGNAFIFTQKLSEKCQQAGVTFLFNTKVNKIISQQGKVTGVCISHSDQPQQTHIHADCYVLCMGSFSTPLAKEVGLNLQVYPAKGYSATYPVTHASHIPQTSLIDDAYKLVFSRFEAAGLDQFRVAGMAEIRGGKRKYQRDIQLDRAELITQRVQQLFPQGLDFSQPNYWTGLRPTTPSNIPYIGQSAISNLYLNTGHGTLGWTHACGSAKALSNIMLGKQPALDFVFL